MKQIIENIKKYIHNPCSVVLSEDADDLRVYDILNESNEYTGAMEFDELNRLKSFEYITKYKSPKKVLSKDEIIDKTISFLKESTTDNYIKNQISSMIYLEGIYMITFEEKDKKYQLLLPNTGTVICIGENGHILNFKRADDYEVVYSDSIITREEAEKKFLEKLSYDLKIKQTEDRLYHLVYEIKQSYLNIPANNEEPEMYLEENHIENIEPFETSSKNLKRIIGLKENYNMISKKHKKNDRIELWSRYTKRQLPTLNYHMDIYQPGVIKYRFDRQTNELLEIKSGDIIHDDMGNEISLVFAKNRAFDFLFTLYHNADELFQMEYSEDGLIEDHDFRTDAVDTLLIEDYEPMFAFYFYRIHDNIQIDGESLVIGVGKYSGVINYYQSSSVSEKELAHISVFAKVSETEAIEIYAKELEMKLAFVDKYDETGKSIFNLVYQVNFKKSDSDIHSIDAETGQILYTDMADSLFR